MSDYERTKAEAEELLKYLEALQRRKVELEVSVKTQTAELNQMLAQLKELGYESPKEALDAFGVLMDTVKADRAEIEELLGTLEKSIQD